nr:AAA family ATPase [Phytoactinopolyspora mesophila]
MRKRVPRFVAFAEGDRALPTDTPIHTEEARAGIRPAIRNLLTVAGIDVEELWAACAASDSGEAKTILGNGNERLDAFFGQAWNQANISVHLDVNGRVLTTHIYEIDNKRYTRIEERSDGLRAFVALAAFLEAQDFSTLPILLIDEAETHLHFDAQADLVGVLLKQVKATQIFYTTHSPGCLPSDLGTGIRLLKRNGPTSDIVSHFWTNEAPGFGALLFAMGAGAAAFSACRWAVLAEGPSEMILLPTLLRQATELDDLPYQVAPGLSNARAYDMDVEEIAAKVVYLADGDGDGDRYQRELEGAGVDSERIFGLPRGRALEDLLDPTLYLETVAGMLADGAPKPSVKDMEPGIPIALSLARWAAQQSPAVELPGKVAVAYAVLDSSEITLATGAQATLKRLHTDFVAALMRRESVDATTKA